MRTCTEQVSPLLLSKQVQDEAVGIPPSQGVTGYPYWQAVPSPPLLQPDQRHYILCMLAGALVEAAVH